MNRWALQLNDVRGRRSASRRRLLPATCRLGKGSPRFEKRRYEHEPYKSFRKPNSLPFTTRITPTWSGEDSCLSPSRPLLARTRDESVDDEDEEEKKEEEGFEEEEEKEEGRRVGGGSSLERGWK